MVALVSEIENELDVALMLADASACNTISDLVDLNRGRNVNYFTI